MTLVKTDEPPFKKRRFLAEPVTKVEPVLHTFQKQLSEFLGEEIDHATAVILERLSAGNVQDALNMWFDESWKTAANGHAKTPTNGPDKSPLTTTVETTTTTPDGEESPSESVKTRYGVESAKPSKVVSPTWKRRYLGSFGTQGYLTSSTTLLADQKLRITRQSTLPPRGKSAKPPAKSVQSRPGFETRTKGNYITRICLQNGTEVGRLSQESAIIVSTLMDLEICSFEAVVIFAPERARVGSNVDLMISCYMRKSAMQLNSGPSAEHDSLDNSSESAEERILKLRRFSLVKLFESIGLTPTRGSDTLKEVAQMAESSIDNPQQQKKSGESGSESDEDGEELHADQLDTLYSKAQTFDHNMPLMEPASTFEFTLKPYQKQALHWMVNKERHTSDDARKVESMHPLWQEFSFPPDPELKDSSPEAFYMNPYSGEMSSSFPRALDECRGGILADEMGLGKTIEILSLIHTAKLERQGDSETATVTTSDLMANTTQQSHTTLVVAPLTLIQQWQSEAENASKEGTLKTILYYGAEKALDLGKLCCGPSARMAPDLIITSYGVVLSEYTKYLETGKASGLFAVDFYRVVLDEAHTIKNRQAKTSRACYNIKARKRWALTGTPIVNKLEDLYSLVHYLGVEPWGVYSFWRTFITLPFESKEYIKALDVVQTVLEPLVLRRTKDMKDVDGQPIVDLPSKTIEMVHLDFSEDERSVYNFISARARREYNQNALAGTVMKNYTYILSMILRLRQSCCDPTLVKQKVDQSELAADEVIDAKDSLEDDPLADVDLSDLIAKFQSGTGAGEKSATSFGASVLQQISEGAEKECPICAEEPIQEQTVTKCFHMACKQCLLNHIKFQESRGEEPLCHTCRQPVAVKDLLEVVRHAPREVETREETRLGSGREAAVAAVAAVAAEQVFLRPAQHTLGSTKIDKLLKSLHETRRIDPRIKSVVFSQFTSFLDIIQKSLLRQGLPFLRLDGAMTQKERAAVLQKFRDTPGNMTFIISLKAGGVGLNLTNAHHVYMLDPWWSFAIESQAIDRIHRMGQTREVKVFRYIIRQSVEEKMLKIQERKNFLASSLGMSKEEKRRETLKDIQTLFED